jgi:hypothetical protein
MWILMCSSPIDRAAGSGTVRSDAYEPLQVAKELDGVRQETFSLPAMPKGSYGEVIKGPALRIEGTGHPSSSKAVTTQGKLDTQVIG